MSDHPETCCDETVAQPSILVLSIQEAEQELLLNTIGECTNWNVSFVGSEKEALQRVGIELPTVFLLDLQDLGKRGLDFIDTMRRKHPLVPVVVLIRKDDEPVFQALRRGAVNYIPWRLMKEELVNTLESVLLAAEVRRCKNRLLGHLHRFEMQLSLGNDITLIPALISLLQDTIVGIGICESGESIRVNMALEEALVNAIYHGNLEVSSRLRNDPDRGDEPYQEEIEKRRRLPPFRDRKVDVAVFFEPHQAVFVIRDEGPGFDPQSLPDPTDPANIELASGRGLLLIRTFMDEVHHNPTGNEITMIKRKQLGKL